MVKIKILLSIILATLGYNLSYSREYIYTLTDKGIYETCEDLWFKCIAIDDSVLCISNKSHTAYVEIVDPSDSVVWREKYRMANGMCDGHAYVGDDWKSGEYRMYVHTRNSLGRGDMVVYPKRLLIVNELPEAPKFLTNAKERMNYIDIPNTTITNKLNVTVTLDSAQYHTRSKVRATVKVTDAESNPMRAVLAMSVADALYSYPPSDIDIHSQLYGIKTDSLNKINAEFEPFLSDGAVSGYLRSRNKKNTIPLDDQYINVFDDVAEKGAVNIIKTHDNGYFEVSPEIASSLNRTVLLRPLVNEDMKPRLDIDNPFRDIECVRKSAKEHNFPLNRNNTRSDTCWIADYTDRNTIQLDEVLVEGKSKYFSRRKKNKLMNYLDSIALASRESAWVCCGHIVNGEYVDGFLNDYMPGYNHHPLDDPYYSKTPPKNIRIPERGKLYKMIKMRWDESMQCYTYEHESFAIYGGPQYSDEDLLSMECISKSCGYYPRHRFKLQSKSELIDGISDFRNTLLWLPRAQTDDNGEFSVEFLTSDINSKFNLSVLSISETGIINQIVYPVMLR